MAEPASRSSAAVLRLVPRSTTLKLKEPAINRDTVECLQLLLLQALKGEIVGLAVCAMLADRAYIVDTAGEAQSNPTFARGMLAALDDHLADRLRGN